MQLRLSDGVHAPRALSVGVTGLALQGPAFEALRPELERRCGAFLRAPTPEDRTVHIEATGTALSEHPAPVWHAVEHRFRLEYPLYAAQGSLRPGAPVRARLRLAPEGMLPGAERLLGLCRALATELFRPMGALVFHGCATELVRGLGVLVLGPKGAGKTTFGRGGWVGRRFSDDHALIDTGAPPGPQMVGVPFTGREGLRTVPGRSPLRGILLPRRGTPGRPPKLRPVSRTVAAESLLRNLICLDPRPGTFEENLEALEGLTRRLPVLELRYDAPTADPAGLVAAIEDACG